MSVDCCFRKASAEAAGVKFTPVMGERGCENLAGCSDEGWCYCQDRKVPVIVGWHIEAPGGEFPTILVGHQVGDRMFSCKSSNVEAREWFLANVRGARLSR